MAPTKRELRQRGYTQADIDLALKQQEAEKRSGSRPRTLAAVLAGQRGRTSATADPIDLTARQLRRRGDYGQAALLADQAALRDNDPERAAEARSAALVLKGLADRPKQMEFDFFMANTSTGHQYHDAIRDRLLATTITPAEFMAARTALHEIVRWLGWQSFECEKTAAELADLLRVDPAVMARSLKLLEDIGAIARVKRGRSKVITVTPEGAYRGDINRHAETVDRYRAEVVPLRRRNKTQAPPEPVA